MDTDLIPDVRFSFNQSSLNSVQYACMPRYQGRLTGYHVIVTRDLEHLIGPGTEAERYAHVGITQLFK
jgi:hypothetical protein